MYESHKISDMIKHQRGKQPLTKGSKTNILTEFGRLLPFSLAGKAYEVVGFHFHPSSKSSAWCEYDKKINGKSGQQNRKLLLKSAKWWNYCVCTLTRAG